jgi:ribosomal protein S27AE
VAKKKYDPLWEIVDEKVALQGREPDIDVPCPHCAVTVHLGTRARSSERYACGLCGGVSQVVQAGGAWVLERVD